MTVNVYEQCFEAEATVNEVERRAAKVMLISAVVISVIELTQMFTLRGYCDIDDLILNEAGVALGYLSRKIFS